MWKKIISLLKAATVKQKILALIAALLVVSTVVAVPVLLPKLTKPVDGQHTEVVQGNPEEDTDKDTDKNQEGDGTATTVVEVSQDNGSTNKKGGSLPEFATSLIKPYKIFPYFARFSLLFLRLYGIILI